MGTLNKMSDLNNILFAQLERLNDEEGTKGEDLQREITRANAITDVAQQIIANAALGLKAEVARAEYCGSSGFKVPPMLGDGENKAADKS